MSEHTAEYDHTDPMTKARIAVTGYDESDWRDLHLVDAQDDCVDECVACVADDLLGVLREVATPPTGSD